MQYLAKPFYHTPNLGMANPDSGKIMVCGLDHREDAIAMKDRIGVVFDSLYLAGHLNVKQTEQQLKLFYKEWDGTEYASRVRQFELSDNRPV